MSMAALIPPIAIVNIMSNILQCQQPADSVQLINRLNDFYNFDHNIFFMHSVTNLNCWFPLSSPIFGIDSTPKTLYIADSTLDRVN